MFKYILMICCWYCCVVVAACCLNSSNMLMQRNRSLLVTAGAAPRRRGLNDLEGCEGRLASSSLTSSLAARHRRSECLQSSAQRRYPHSSVLPRSPPRARPPAFKTSCQRDSRLESAAAEVTSPTAATAQQHNNTAAPSVEVDSAFIYFFTPILFHKLK